jgi:hypothetical protein
MNFIISYIPWNLKLFEVDVEEDNFKILMLFS